MGALQCLIACAVSVAVGDIATALTGWTPIFYIGAGIGALFFIAAFVVDRREGGGR